MLFLCISSEHFGSNLSRWALSSTLKTVQFAEQCSHHFWDERLEQLCRVLQNAKLRLQALPHLSRYSNITHEQPAIFSTSKRTEVGSDASAVRQIPPTDTDAQSLSSYLCRDIMSHAFCDEAACVKIWIYTRSVAVNYPSDCHVKLDYTREWVASADLVEGNRCIRGSGRPKNK